MVTFLITRKANVNQADPCQGFTALHRASDLGNVPMMELLISKGAKHDMRDKFGCFPLQNAAYHGHKEAVACLLDHGADINVCYYSGNTPLMTAAVHCQFKAVKFLVLKGADLNAANYEGWTHRGHCDVVNFLVRSGSRFELYGTAMRK